MLNTNVELEDVLANFRELVGIQAQEIATLRALVSTLDRKLAEKESASE